MLIETNANHRHIRTLNFGSFPANVLSFRDSYEYLEKLIYYDYQVQKRYHGIRGLASVIENGVNHETDIKFLDSSINALEAINADFATGMRSYQEVFYSVNVLGYLLLLKNDKHACFEVLRSFKFNDSLTFETETDKKFYDYLYARYCTMLGLCTDNNIYWIDYLIQLEKYGERSEVAINAWIQFLCKSLIRRLSVNGTKPLTFQDFELLKLPKSSFVILVNCSSKPENDQYISSSVTREYSSFLTKLIDTEISAKSKSFPDSESTDKTEENFVHSLYETLNDISSHKSFVHQFLKPKASKQYLVSKLQTTYQSRNILVNMIETQTDLKLFDEAIAAFKTFNSYVLKEKEQNGGMVNDVLQILDIFSHCFQVFNPSNSFRSQSLFKYNDLHEVLKTLSDLVPTFLEYLSDARKLTDLNFDDDDGHDFSSVDRPISFLYHDSNPQVVLSTYNKLSSTMANAWFSLSKYYQYLATFNSSEAKVMLKYLELGHTSLKRSLHLDCAGNVTQLHSYALILAHQNKLKSAAKLCKFTLKKYPNSFKTWNLLVLTTSAIEKQIALDDTSVANSDILDDQSLDQADGGFIADTSKLSLSKSTGTSRSERFIVDALNLASIYLLNAEKARKKLTEEVKYDVIQLKLTQLELMRQKHGVDYAFELVSELFDLYREIYSVSTTSSTTQAERKQGKKWSHRPSVIDPHESSHQNGKDASRSTPLHEKFKELSPRKSISDGHSTRASIRANGSTTNGSKPDAKTNSKNKDSQVLQEIWLWAAGMYQELNLYDEAEQCIVEAETVCEPNVKSFTAFGILASKSRKFLALQEYEKSLEMYHQPNEKFNKAGYGTSLLAMCHLFMIDDKKDNSLFVSQKDLEAGLIRLKNYLEDYSHCWPYGYTNSGVWYFLSLIYEKFDDKVLYEKALWRCIDIESSTPVRPYSVCELVGP